MIRYGEALTLLRALAESHRIGNEDVPLFGAHARVAADEILSSVSVPRFANSQMDGFAVIAADTPGTLSVSRKIVAGDAPLQGALQRGEAVAIMTGAAIPPGADAVVKIEDVHGAAPSIDVRQIVAGSNVRKAGEDFAPGDRIMLAGQRLHASHLLALAAVGIGRVAVKKRPRVALIATGKELVLPGESLTSAGSIWCSSLVYLQSALTTLGCEVTTHAIVHDDVPTFHRELDRALQADLVITTGAVSAGEHDFIPGALRDRQARILFHKVAIRPGKPILLAELGRSIVLSLPGNPVSTVVGMRFFATPLLQALTGEIADTAVTRTLAGDVAKPEGLRCFFKAHSDGNTVAIDKRQGSHLVAPLRESDCWAELPEEGATVSVGSAIATRSVLF